MSKNKFAAFNFLLYLCARFRRLAMGYWLWAIGYWRLAIGDWLLVMGDWRKRMKKKIK